MNSLLKKGNQIKSWCPFDGLRFAVKKQNNVEKYKKFDALAINCQVCGMFYVGYIKTWWKTWCSSPILSRINWHIEIKCFKSMTFLWSFNFVVTLTGNVQNVKALQNCIGFKFCTLHTASVKVFGIIPEFRILRPTFYGLNSGFWGRLSIESRPQNPELGWF